jgi:hypothetical protein
VNLNGDAEVTIPATGDFFNFPKRRPRSLRARSSVMQRGPRRARESIQVSVSSRIAGSISFAVPSLENHRRVATISRRRRHGTRFLLLKWVLEVLFCRRSPAFTSINATVQPDGLSVRNEVFDRLNAAAMRSASRL